MKTAYEQGMIDTMRKLGVADNLRNRILQKNLSSSEAQQPLDMNDEHLPVHVLTEELKHLRVPKRMKEDDSSSQSIEDRLNRPTVWGPKEEISQDTATGPSPIGLRY